MGTVVVVEHSGGASRRGVGLVRFFLTAGLLGSAGLLAACSSGSDVTTSAPQSTTSTVVSETVSTTTTGSSEDPNAQLETAEAFIDAFYSYDLDALEAFLASAETSKPFILFYQGWAEGAQYRVLERMCESRSATRFICAITVEDDLLLALGSDFKVTDQFILTFDGESIVRVTTGSDDPSVVRQAFAWVNTNRPELADGVCLGMFDGGPTPGDCAAAVVQGFEDFAASESFPGPP